MKKPNWRLIGIIIGLVVMAFSLYVYTRLDSPFWQILAFIPAMFGAGIFILCYSPFATTVPQDD